MTKDHAQRVLKVIEDLAEEIDVEQEEIIDALLENNLIKYKAHAVLYNLLEEEQ